MLSEYGKVLHVGHRGVASVFDGDVVVQEKIDGSQLSWCCDEDGALRARSRGQVINVADPPKLFGPAIEHLRAANERGCIARGLLFRGEAVCGRRHNRIEYERVPAGCVVLFEAGDGAPLYGYARTMGVEAVSELYRGRIDGPDALHALLPRESFLGGMCEGLVVKNYGQVDPNTGAAPLKAKLVSGAFAETARVRRPRLGGGDGLVGVLSAAVATEARFEKAVQRLSEDGVLTNSLADIGALLAKVGRDVNSESGDWLAEQLVARGRKAVLRAVSTRAAEWYKERLTKGGV
jgi:hypothetical protein